MRRFVLVSLALAVVQQASCTYPTGGAPAAAPVPGLGVGAGVIIPGLGSTLNKLYPGLKPVQPVQQPVLQPILPQEPAPAQSQQQDSYNDVNSKRRDIRVIYDEDFQYECLDRINRKRRQHEGTRSLQVGFNYTRYTVDRANSILRDIENQQDITKGRYALGESFFYYYDPNKYRSVDDAINTWYSESRNYDYNRPGFSAKTGGFTQLVWKATREVSCAKIEYETRTHYKTLVVCNFYPAGNVNGEFPYNVAPLRRGGGGGGGSRPDYDEDRPSRPGGGGGGRPGGGRPGGGRPDYDEDRPSRPGGGGGGRPGGGRPDYDEDRPSRPGGGGRPRPPYDEDRPNRPGGGGYPTHPIRVSGSTEIVLPLPSSVADKPEVAQPAAVLVAQVNPSVPVVEATQPAQSLGAPTQYSSGSDQIQPAAQTTDEKSVPKEDPSY